MSNFDIIMISGSGFKKRFVILGIPFYYFSAAFRTRFSDIAISRNRNGMQTNLLITEKVVRTVNEYRQQPHQRHWFFFPVFPEATHRSEPEIRQTRKSDPAGTEQLV